MPKQRIAFVLVSQTWWSTVAPLLAPNDVTRIDNREPC